MNNWLKRLVGYAYIPASFSVYWALHQTGIPGFWVFYGGTGILIVMNHLMEQLMPWEKSWRKADDQLVNEVGHTFLTALVGHTLGRFLAVTLMGALVVAAPVTGRPWWPNQLPFAAQVALAVLIWDLGIYWNHRFLHSSAWRFHSLHHKLRRLTWLNSGYGHPIQFVTTSFCGISLLYLVGLPKEVAIFTSYWTFALNFLPHSNINMEMGFLNYIFSTPQVHRWHHIGDENGRQVNFGMHLSIWDIVFGTFILPKKEADPALLGDPEPHPAGFLAQWVGPFVPESVRARWATIPSEREPFTIRNAIGSDARNPQ